jgi:indole-3-glycerol phosphate synthase
VPRVAESGVAGAEDAQRLGAAGYGLILVGSALMRDQDPAGLARALIEAGRAAHRTS